MAEILDTHAKGQHIDFMDVDIESQELNTLSSFPFHNYSIKLITVEVNHVSQKRMQAVMQNGGFVQSPVFPIGGDTFWQNRTMLQGSLRYVKPPFKPMMG